jgi:hypothetical protein
LVVFMRALMDDAGTLVNLAHASIICSATVSISHCAFAEREMAVVCIPVTLLKRFRLQAAEFHRFPGQHTEFIFQFNGALRTSRSELAPKSSRMTNATRPERCGGNAYARSTAWIFAGLLIGSSSLLSLLLIAYRNRTDSK